MTSRRIRRLISAIAIVAATVLSSSCGLDILHMFDKLENVSYIQNETNLDVTISRESPSGLQTFTVKAGEEQEIPDTFRWSITTKNIESADTVYFRFSDGSSYIHTSKCTDDKSANVSVTYDPMQNNILYHEMLDDGSWVKTRLRAMKYRYTYYVR